MKPWLKIAMFTLIGGGLTIAAGYAFEAAKKAYKGT